MLEKLNKEQQKAVKSTEGPVRIVAGPGTGKTKTLAHRFSYLVDELNMSTANILCVTFTRKAQTEMQDRIRSLIGNKDLGLICTFHSLCHKIIKADCERIGWNKDFGVMDDRDTEHILDTIYAECGMDKYRLSHSAAKALISDSKKGMPDYIELMTAKSDEELLSCYKSAKDTARLYYGFIYHQKKRYLLDFNDLLILAIHILTTCKDVCKKWQDKIDYIMVDEYQDVNDEQYLLCKILAGYKRNIFVVGDIDQNIYSFRGALPKYFVDFIKDYPEAKTIMLIKNYRSTPEIIDVAKKLISNNIDRIDKPLESTRASGVKVQYFCASTDIDEAEKIANGIQLMQDSGLKLSEMAVLYKAKLQNMALSRVFREKGIPFQVEKSSQFYHSSEIKYFHGLLNMIASGEDWAFTTTINTPKRGFGKAKLEILKEYQTQNGGTLYEALKACKDSKKFAKTNAKEYIEMIEKYRLKVDEMHLSDIAKGILIDSGYEAFLRTQNDDERLDNIAAIVSSINSNELEDEELTLDDYLENMVIYTELEEAKDQNAVNCMTIHASKGLEFKTVFIVGLNEGLLPSSKADTIEKLEEERRVLYVGITRAEDRLYLSSYLGDSKGKVQGRPSRFLKEIRDNLQFIYSTKSNILDNDGIVGETKVLNKESPYTPGDRISHKVWGSGSILDVDLVNSSYDIFFDELGQHKHIAIGAEAISRV